MILLALTDSPTDTRVLERMLKTRGEHGYDVEHADSVQAGLDMLDREAVDVILLHYPWQGAYDLAPLRQLVTRSGGAAVVVVGDRGEGFESAVLQAGAMDYLPRGRFDASLLQRCMRHAYERRQLQIALHDAMERYHQLVNATPDAIILTDMQGNILSLSPQALALHGYESAQEVIGKPAFDLLAPGACDDFENELRRALAGEPLDCEVTLQRRDGSTFIGELHAASLHDENGQPIGLITVTRDITDRLQQASDLQSARHDLTRLMTSIPDALWNAEVSQDGILTYRYISPVIERITGLKPEDYTPRSLNQFRSTFPDDREQVWSQLKPFYERRVDSVEMEYRIMMPNGGVRWVRDRRHSSPNPDGTLRIDAVLSDITEQRQVENAYRALVEQSLQELLIMQDDRVVYANPTAIKNSGFSLDEMLAMPAGEFYNLIHPDDRERVLRTSRARSTGRPAPNRQEFRVFVKDGSLRWVEVLTTLIEYRGRPSIQIVQFDITERKRAEERLRERFAIEELATTLSTRFINVSNDMVDDMVTAALQTIGKFIRVDQVYLYLLDSSSNQQGFSFVWNAEDETPAANPVELPSLDEQPWLQRQLERLETVIVERVSDLPAAAKKERAQWEAWGLVSVLEIPLVHAGKLVGHFGFAARHRVDWAYEDIRLLRLMGDVFVNVLDHRKMEQALRESESQYRLLADSVTDVISLHNLDASFVYISASGEKLIGMSMGQILSMHPDMLVHPEDLGKIREIALDKVQAGENVMVEWRCKSADGGWVWMESNLHILKDENGQPCRLLASSRNIQERKQSEEAEQAAKQERDRILISVPDALWSAEASPNGSWTYQYISPVIANLTGYTPAEILEDQRLSTRIIHHDDRPGVLYEFNRINMGIIQHLNLEYRVTHRDGSLRWVRDSQTAQRMNGVIRVDGVLSDITERKKAEEALQQAHDQLTFITATISDYLWSGEMDHLGVLKINYLSPVVEKLLGYTPDEVIGSGIEAWINKIDSADRSIFERFLKDILSTNRRSFATEYRIRRKDGSVCWVRDSVEVRQVADDRYLLNGVVTDITERKQTELQLQQANERLKQSITELEERNRQITMVNEMGDLMQSCLSTSDIFEVISSYGGRLFAGHSGAVFMLDERKRLVEAASVWGKALHSHLVYEPEQCWALRRGRVHVVENPGNDLDCGHIQSAGKHVYMCIPMIAHGETLGAFYLELDQGGMDDRYRQTASLVAERISLALANLKLQESLQSQSIRDALTGLYNRRYMEDAMEREIRQSARQDQPIGVIMMDLDHFKQFNDVHGHAAGDVLLAIFGEYLESSVRSGDIACRYGGDEFVVVLPNATLPDTVERATQIREGMKRLVVQYRGQTLGNITASMGISAFPEHGEDMEEILRAADNALYVAKDHGRDRVVIAG